MPVEIQFRYAMHIDLLYHVLAHMRVPNASDLFDPLYMEKVQRMRPTGSPDLRTPLLSLEEYYNQHFDRLGIVNFLPLYSRDFEEMKNRLRCYSGFTPQDMSLFIAPFIDLLEQESCFFFPCWVQQYHEDEMARPVWEYEIKQFMNKCGGMFAYSGRFAQVCLSDAMTRNGRGFSGWENAFGAVAPIPRTPEAIDNTCFILLHEYTHQLTDALLKTSIHMDDGSHELSENVVVRFDYDWLEMIDEPLLNRYMEWIADKSGRSDEAVLLKEEFVRLFPVPEMLEREMDLLVGKIVNHNT